MDALAVVVLIALVGGALAAGVLKLTNRRASPDVVVPAATRPLSPDAINMAHIKVEGVGGLGLIAAVVIVAINLPEIGFSLLAAVSLGAVLAVGLIAYRSHVADVGQGGSEGQPPSVLMLDVHRARVQRHRGRELPRARAAATA